jgi:hypothetical protein
VTFAARGTDAAAVLRERANPDGGFSPTQGTSEPEPTAVAALALGAGPAGEAARSWLRARQRRDGTWAAVSGLPRPTIAPTALAALVLEEGEPRARAVDALARLQAPVLKGNGPPDKPVTRGWGWTPRTFGWVEPTSWATLALKRLRPTERGLVEDGERILADRECVGGGWNYGNRTVYEQELPPYVQTTAVALIALQGSGTGGPLVARGMHLLRARWRDELGGLTTAMSLLALRLIAGDDDVDTAAARAALIADLDATVAFGDNLALAWAAVALTGDLGALRVPT